MAISHVNIAIDGPAGAGKSTAARGLADSLHIHILDSGALFRAFALRALRKGADLADPGAVERALDGATLDVQAEADGQRTILDGEDVSQAIRTPEVAAGASAIGAIPYVRNVLTQQVRKIAAQLSVVVDGRDIGTAMLPQADFKFFLTATPEERARRRYEEQRAKGNDQPYEEVLEAIKQRDHFDANRSIAPLKQAEDAFVIDSTDMDAQSVIATMLSIIEGK